MTEIYRGLKSSEIAQARNTAGYNELPGSKPKSILHIVAQVVREPMFLLLISCGSLYMALGDIGEGLMLMASVVIIIIVSFYQERKSQRAIEALRELSSPRTLVIRDGKEERIPSRELVPGDIMILQEGDRVSADAYILESLNLKADESMLSGESVAVEKTSENSDPGKSNPNVYAGSLITQGRGIARVSKTGSNTELGKIGKSLQGIKEEATLLQKETGSIVKNFSILGFAVCILLIIIYGLTRHDWLNGILTGLSLAMAMLPEEFAVVLTIFMALGAWRISKQNVLTRRPASIETLGSVSVLCADKTGTLTENRMTVSMLYSKLSHSRISIPEQTASQEFDTLLKYALLASQVPAFDPMEKAIIHAAEKSFDLDSYSKHKLLREYPLSPALLSMSRVFEHAAEPQCIVAAKGSPEAIAALCKLNVESRNELDGEIAFFASQGLRVLGVAKASCTKNRIPLTQEDFDFEFLGLIALEDPLRASIPENIKSCYEAGIRVIMITGDYPVTAQSIARKMGLKNAEEVVSGRELAAMNELQIKEKIRTCNVFARVLPEQKLMLVNALKENGDIVAMTGDGVNDAPALKSAHIGIAMGGRGTDVARESAGLVLLDDNFSSIITAIRSGRRIYDNMQKAMAYIFSVHLPIAGLTLIPVFFAAYPVILFPLHIALMELIIDPACSLIFENEKEEENIMKRPPRDPKLPVFGWKRIFISSMQGFMVFLICLGIYFLGIYLQRPEDEVRALTFVTLVLANLGLIFMNRSWTAPLLSTFKSSNQAVKWISASALLFLALLLYVPALRTLFHLGFLHLHDILICLGATALFLITFELVKFFGASRRMKLRKI